MLIVNLCKVKNHHSITYVTYNLKNNPLQLAFIRYATIYFAIKVISYAYQGFWFIKI
jgi:hypothetical protein